MAPKKCDAFSNWFWSFQHWLLLPVVFGVSEATEGRWYCKTFLWMWQNISSVSTFYCYCFCGTRIDSSPEGFSKDVINILPLFGRNDSCSVFNACRLTGHPPLYYHSMKDSYSLPLTYLIKFYCLSECLQFLKRHRRLKIKDSWMYENIKQMQ